MRRLPFVLVFLSLLLANQCLAGDFLFTPSVSTGLEYNDNVQETQGGHPDMIYSITPGAKFSYEGPRINFDTDWSYTNKYYLGGQLRDENHHKLAGKGLWKVDGDFFFVSVSDTYSSVNKDTTKGEVQEGDTSSSGKVDQNIFMISPYADLQPSEQTTAKIGYTYTNTTYASGDGVNKENHRLFTELGYEMTPRFRMEVTSAYILQDPEQGKGYTQFRYDVGPRYTYSDDSYIFGRVGSKYTDVEEGGNTVGNTWVAGWVHDLGSSIYKISTSLDEVEDPESSSNKDVASITTSLTKKFDRTDITGSLTYSEYEVTGLKRRVSSVRPTIALNHLLSARFSLYGSVSYDFTRDTSLERKENLYLLTRLSYQLSETSSASLTYNYKNADTSGSTNGCYFRNSLGVSVSLSY